jgi:hypothetical protein
MAAHLPEQADEFREHFPPSLGRFLMPVRGQLRDEPLLPSDPFNR